jgi:hypothetical protein
VWVWPFPFKTAPRKGVLFIANDYIPGRFERQAISEQL